MTIAPIAKGEAPSTWPGKIEALVNYWNGETALSSFGDARTALNAIAGDLGLDMLSDGAGAGEQRAKINAIINGAMAVTPEPAKLFLFGEQGAWLDPSDLDTIFQDAAGTTPVTEPGQSVGRINDKSGDGHHATQETAAARPTYGIVPATGRRNLLTYSDLFSGARWASPSGCTVEEGVQIDGEIASLMMETPEGPLNNQHFIHTWNITFSDDEYAVSVDAKANGRSQFQISVWNYNTGATSLTGTFDLSDGTVSPSTADSATISDLGNGWYRCTVFGAGPNASRSIRIRLLQNGSPGYEGDVSKGIYLRKSQVELGPTPTPYQRVGNQYDVTEEGVPSLHYLAFDGVDDFLVTPSIDFTGTDEMSVFAGVRKLVQAANFEIIAELSNTSVSNSGTFALFDRGGASDEVAFRFRGSTNNILNAVRGSLPQSMVYTGLGDISAQHVAIRKNGETLASPTRDVGAGNLGNYPLHIGARAGGSLPFNGQIFGLIVRGKLSTETEIAATESWMAEKTGVAI